MSDNEQKLRAALSGICAHLQMTYGDRSHFNEALQRARDTLKETEPKHPALVAWQQQLQDMEMYTTDEKKRFLAGYRAGLLEAEKLVDQKHPEGHGFYDAEKTQPCRCLLCAIRKLILEAANQVPKE